MFALCLCLFLLPAAQGAEASSDGAAGAGGAGGRELDRRLKTSAGRIEDGGKIGGAFKRDSDAAFLKRRLAKFDELLGAQKERGTWPLRLWFTGTRLLTFFETMQMLPVSANLSLSLCPTARKSKVRPGRPRP